MLPGEKKERRRKRLESLLLEEISELLLTAVKDPACEGVVLTRVKVSNDLAQALVMVRVRHEKEDVTAQVIPALNRAAGFIQRELGVTLELRRTPKLKFVEDQGIVESIRIAKILDTLTNEGTVSSGDEHSGEASP